MQADDWYRRGEQLLDGRCVYEALECFQSAQRLGADSNRCAAARWQCWMLLGRFECAWAESDFIAASGAHDPHRFWDGQPWHGRRLMLRCLHGLGDTIQFIRFAPLLRKTCSHLTVQAHPQLTDGDHGTTARVPHHSRVSAHERSLHPRSSQKHILGRDSVPAATRIKDRIVLAMRAMGSAPLGSPRCA